MFEKAQVRDDHGLPWVQEGDVGCTGEELRRQNGLEAGKGCGKRMDRDDAPATGVTQGRSSVKGEVMALIKTS